MIDDVTVHCKLFDMNNFYSYERDKKNADGTVIPISDRVKIYDDDLKVLADLDHYNVSPYYKIIIKNYRNSITAERNRIAA